MMAANSDMETTLEHVSDYSNYINQNENVAQELKTFCKSLYEFGQNDSIASKRGQDVESLQEKLRSKKLKRKPKKNQNTLKLSENHLIIDGFGNNEIWNQLNRKCQSLVGSIETRLDHAKFDPKFNDIVQDQNDKNKNKNESKKSKKSKSKKKKKQEDNNEDRKEKSNENEEYDDSDIELDMNDLSLLDEMQSSEEDERGNDNNNNNDDDMDDNEELIDENEYDFDEDEDEDALVDENEKEKKKEKKNLDGNEEEMMDDNKENESDNDNDNDNEFIPDTLSDIDKLENNMDWDAFDEKLENAWDKTQDFAQTEGLEFLNGDLEAQAMAFDEENEINNDNDNDSDSDNDNDNEKKKNRTGNKDFDEFEWLKQNIANDNEDISDDDDDDSDNDIDEPTKSKKTKKKKKNNILNPVDGAKQGLMDDDETWNELFDRIPKFPESKQEESNNNINKKKAKFGIDNDNENLSSFEKEERAIRAKIGKLEEENLKDRSWEYQGEVSNSKHFNKSDDHNKSAVVRPKNSLLSTYLDFDYSDKLKPIISEDLTTMIENLVIDKIKNNQFDDVEPKFDFIKAPVKAKRKLIEISDQKSSMGLAELYERQYLQQVEKAQELENLSKHSLNKDEFMSKEDIEKHRKYEKISRMKGNLFYSLDQLTRFHYTPKPAVMQTNIRVATHTKSIFLEEQLPFTQQTNIDESMTLAPEQIYNKPREKYMTGINEMDRSEKQKKRRENKKRSMYKQKIFEERDKQRAKYDATFAKHQTRIQALNEVRQHALAAAKKDGFIKSDDTKYTSSNQMFAKIQNYENENRRDKKDNSNNKNGNNNNGGKKDNDWKKRRRLMITNKDEWNIQAPSDKRRKVSQLRS